MLSSGANLKWSQEGRTAYFVVDNTDPITFYKEALFQFQAHIARVEEQIKVQQEEAKKSSENKGEGDVVQGEDNMGKDT